MLAYYIILIRTLATWIFLLWVEWHLSSIHFNIKFEPAHEILALFILHKLILQTRMRSHPVGLEVSFMVGPFVYFHTSCERTVKALARLHGCTGSPEPSLVAYVISTIILWDGLFVKFIMQNFLSLRLQSFPYFFQRHFHNCCFCLFL